MHELGHTLDLEHGGGDGVNYKPNYLSVMNYLFQTRGIPPSDPDGPLVGRLDYSRSVLATLVEGSLDENVGIGDGTDSTRFFCPGDLPNIPTGTGPGTGRINWNCNISNTETSVSSDINQDSSLGDIIGFNDWANLKFDFQSTLDFEDGDHSASKRVTEIDYVTHLKLAFDLSVQDDSNASVFQFNSATGEYQFTKCGTGGFTLTGIGSVTRKGGIYTLQHNSSDRRVLARIDKSLNRGTASVQVFSLGTTFTLTDRNTTNNKRICP